MAATHNRPDTQNARSAQPTMGYAQSTHTCINRLATLLATALAVLATAGPAAALQTRGHTFTREFGNDAPGETPLKAPSDVAVSEIGSAAGDIYVVDRANNRIQQYAPDGEPIASWGWGVTDQAKEYEICTTPATCKTGLPGPGKGLEDFKIGKAQLIAPTAIAVDNSKSPGDPSAGDVYVIADAALEHTFIDKFGPDGEYKGRLTSKNEAEEYERAVGITVDPHGTVWVAWSGISGEITRYDDSEPNKRLKNSEREHEEIETQVEPLRAGFGVDTTGHPYVDYEPEEQFTEAPESTRESEEGKGPAGEEPCERARCLPAELRGGEQTASSDPGEALVEELDQDNTTGIAIDNTTETQFAGDIYLDNQQTITELDPTGQVLEHFGEGHLQHGAGLAVDAATGDVYVADSATGQIELFEPEPDSAPVVSSLSAQDVTAQSAQLNALINPHGQSTTYQFEYGTSPCAPKPSVCTTSPAEPATLPAGFGDQHVSVAIERGASSLLANTTYHYRVKASNASGETEPSPEATFHTPAETGEYRADGRGFELVSPPVKGGSALEAITEEGGTIQAAANGSAISYVSDSPVCGAEGNRSFEPTQVISIRGQETWACQDVNTPNEQGNGLQIGKPPEYQAFSPDLSLALVEPFIGGGPLAEPPLSPVLTPTETARGQEKTIYLRADTPILPQPPSATADQPERQTNEEQKTIYSQARANGETMSNTGYLPLISALNTEPVGEPSEPPSFGGHLAFLGATADLTHVVIESEIPLGLGAAAKGNLYEWTAGHLSLINILPGAEHTAAANARLGYKNGIVHNAISDDGKRVIWSASNHLYMRDLQTETTIQLDAPGPGGSNNAPGTRDNPIFQGASSDGNRVFFTDERPLLADSGAKVGSADLFACEIVQETNQPTCQLSDLTPAGPEPHAAVQGLLLGNNTEGTSVYFVADGVLSTQAHEDGARPGHCENFENERSRPPGTTTSCNLYTAQLTSGAAGAVWQPARFIARLSSQDSPDWEPPVTLSNLNGLTSRTSGDGRYLAFMSDQPLTGYDNEDATSQHTGERLDEEVFLYDTNDATLTCVSCNPTNSRPHGILDPKKGEDAGEEGLGLLVDRPKTWEGHWLAANIPGWTTLDHVEALYQSHYLNDSGRVYFNSPADLVPEATNAQEDVYEYEPEGIPEGSHRCAATSSTYSAAAKGCIGLISAGSSTREAAFLDASETGGEERDGSQREEGGSDVFFLTQAKLTSQDIDEAFDVYDAHECTPGTPCLTPTEPTPATPCESTGTCRPGEFTPPDAPSPPASSQTGPADNLSGQGGVLPEKTSKPKPAPSPLQKLKQNLAACRKLKPGTRRHNCETRARRAYAASKLATARKTCKALADKRRRASCEKRAKEQYAKALRLAAGHTPTKRSRTTTR